MSLSPRLAGEHLDNPLRGVTVPQRRHSVRTIAGLGDDRARFVFEMDHYSKMTLRLMAKWDYQRSDCFELRYEDLIADREGALFARAAAHLGFGPEEIDEVKALFVKNSIFQTPSRPEHIRSGAVAQWRTLEGHRAAQAKGRAGVFANYRLRIASVIRDYGMTDRAQAPSDSREANG